MARDEVPTHAMNGRINKHRIAYSVDVTVPGLVKVVARTLNKKEAETAFKKAQEEYPNALSVKIRQFTEDEYVNDPIFSEGLITNDTVGNGHWYFRK
jgi:hypothetical protein